MNHTKVFILYTGGTIGMAPSNPEDPDSALKPQPLDVLLKFVPGSKPLDKLKSEAARNLAKADKQFFELPNGNLIEFGFESLAKPVDSSDISPAEWKEMAAKIAAAYSDFDGFVILHGTDTMAFTSSALSFMFENLGKPVVITGSQLPISAARTDAILNFINAIYLAGYKATDLPLIPEVVIAFADRILRGCRASKVSTSDWAGFDSPNFPRLGAIGEHIVVSTGYVLPPPAANKKFFVKSDLVGDVFNINIFPGFSDNQMQKLFLDSAVEGLVMRTYGTGNVPGNSAFLTTIQRSIDGDSTDGSPVAGGRLIVNLSQCSIGTVEMGLYEASSGLLEAGVLSGLDMTPEAALTKLMWTLGTQFGQGRINQMQISQRGEQTENLFDLRFHGTSSEKVVGKFTNSVSPDGRLDRDRISRAMLRIASFGVENAEVGDEVRIRAYMNMPSATSQTDPEKEERCVANFTFKKDAKKPVQTQMKNITYKTQSAIGSGEVILTLIGDVKKGKKWVPAEMVFSGLYIAVYAKA
ncbi:MAG: asparaginase [Sulfuritalea sp.]|nr:asparaginase [Sulfuritalea sp.]MDP1981815.1 asparaginase [Sulfuritalea sp.]